MVKSQLRTASSIDQISHRSIGYPEDFSITHLANIRPSHVTRTYRGGAWSDGAWRGESCGCQVCHKPTGALTPASGKSPCLRKEDRERLGNHNQYMTEIPQAHRPCGGFLHWPLGQYLYWSGDQFVLQGQGDGLSPVGNVEFGQDVADVGLGSRAADDETLGDFWVAESLHHQVQHLPFPWC